MKKFSTLIFFLLFPLLMLQAREVSVFLSYCTFSSPQDGPYVETYFAFQGKTVTFVQNEKGAFQAKLEILILFKQNDSIKAFRKYNLFSPEISDTSKTDLLFHDQQRISLPNGEYEMEVSIRDANGTADAYVVKEPLSINYSLNEVQLSGIELLQSATKVEAESVNAKAGYDLLPLPLNIYPSSVNKLLFYTEIYNAQTVLGDTGKYLFRVSVEEVQTGRKIPGLLFQKRMDARQVGAVLQELDITGLLTGSYFLVAEVKDRNNEQLAVNRIYFERWNDSKQPLSLVDDEYVKNSFVNNFNNIDTLKEYILSLRPISTAQEKDFTDANIKTADLLTLKRFFLNFWVLRNEENPEKAWLTYAVEVRKVNANFGTLIRKGYETDRGRVYLQYGPPNTITAEGHDPGALPYEIWHYYKLNNQSNRKFVFCEFDLATNNYELIHSDATGELYDGNWMARLHKARASEGVREDTDYETGWGSKVKEYYNTPH